MKKTAAIFFLLIFLFNLYGYRLLIDCIQTKKEAVLLTQLDNEIYTETDLLLIKTPIALPYYTNSATYDRVNGTIEIDGTEYKYVKRRIFNDSLELLCLPNTAKQHLQTVAVNFFKLTNEGLPASGKSGPVKMLKNVLPEFCNALPDYHFSIQAVAPPHFTGTSSLFLPARHYLQQHKPPELA